MELQSHCRSAVRVNFDRFLSAIQPFSFRPQASPLSTSAVTLLPSECQRGTTPLASRLLAHLRKPGAKPRQISGLLEVGRRRERAIRRRQRTLRGSLRHPTKILGRRSSCPSQSPVLEKQPLPWLLRSCSNSGTHRATTFGPKSGGPLSFKMSRNSC